MFDRGWFSCPHCLHRKIEAQSKSGECLLADYDSERVPLSVASGIVDDSVMCGSCGRNYRVVAREHKYVSLSLEEQ